MISEASEDERRPGLNDGQRGMVKLSFRNSAGRGGLPFFGADWPICDTCYAVKKHIVYRVGESRCPSNKLTVICSDLPAAGRLAGRATLATSKIADDRSV
jgi:hypothetical protein